jgi:hypothetical protein
VMPAICDGDTPSAPTPPRRRRRRYRADVRALDDVDARTVALAAPVPWSRAYAQTSATIPPQRRPS